MSRCPRSRDSRRNGSAGSSHCSRVGRPRSRRCDIARFAAEGDFAFGRPCAAIRSRAVRHRQANPPADRSIARQARLECSFRMTRIKPMRGRLRDGGRLQLAAGGLRVARDEIEAQLRRRPDRLRAPASGEATRRGCRALPDLRHRDSKDKRSAPASVSAHASQELLPVLERSRANGKGIAAVRLETRRRRAPRGSAHRCAQPR